MQMRFRASSLTSTYFQFYNLAHHFNRGISILHFDWMNRHKIQIKCFKLVNFRKSFSANIKLQNHISNSVYHKIDTKSTNLYQIHQSFAFNTYHYHYTKLLSNHSITWNLSHYLNLLTRNLTNRLRIPGPN